MEDKHYLYQEFKKWCKKNPQIECIICGEPVNSIESIGAPGGRAYHDCYDKAYG